MKDINELKGKSGIYFITEDALSPGNDDSKKVVKSGKATCLKTRIEKYKINWNGVRIWNSRMSKTSISYFRSSSTTI